MATYQKLPVNIRATQYKGDFIQSDGKKLAPPWLFEAIDDGTMFMEGQGEWYINTLEGKQHVSVDDYIVKGVDGELYPCKPNIFRRTYKKVSDED